MSTVLVCLSKLGDVISAIPIAHAAFKRTGEKVKWVVSLHYVSPLLGCSFVEPIKVQYAQNRIDFGCDTARQAGATEILLAQCFGQFWKGDHSHPYNRQAWVNCKMGDAFDKVSEYPLVFDRRDPEREAMLCQRVLRGAKPTLLMSLSCARSSPFPSHFVLSEAIKRKWERHFEIVDLCGLRAARVYDVLGLMEKAALLITADSVFLHLAAAAPSLPVVFLSNDQHFLASDPRCRCVLRLTYSKWHSNIKAIHGAICNSLDVHRDS